MVGNGGAVTVGILSVLMVFLMYTRLPAEKEGLDIGCGAVKRYRFETVVFEDK